VDPLDGTKEFIKRNDEFTVNIALIHHNTPVAGVVLLPVKKELYIANVTIPGAYFCKLNTLDESPSVEFIHDNAVALPVPKEDTIFRVVGSRSHMNEETEQYIEDLKKDYPKIDIVSAGSSLKICLIAHGKADIYPRFGPTMEWDTAAGHAIVLGAGKQIVKPDGSPVVYNKENLLNPYFIVK
ncbi:MAG: 3'(2'),5'-bisphosphate nucleotidase CysQ, partial [Bacteroidales bacterium]|nr:3'(2'),5'-bisphosphate nucleotidase CysQ [Bacteroidales bacterium]